MKTKQIFWGVFFISVGILVLLRNYLNIELEWGDLWKIWPLIFVLIGLNLLLKNNLAKGIISGVTAFVLAFALYASIMGVFGLVRDDVNIKFHNNDHDFDISTYNAPYEKDIKDAVLNFEAGAGTFILSDTTNDLFSAVVEGKKNSYSLTSKIDEDNADLLFQMKSTHFFPGKNKNRSEIKLNPTPLWNLNFDIGAAAIDFDLSPYKISNVDIDMGAASLRLRLGNLNEKMNVNIEAGASSIDIDLPEDAGCEISADVSLSSKNFEGFNKENEKTYRTENFENSKRKIYINLQSGVSSINVRRYSW